MIIGLHGALQSGKDTAYQLIEWAYANERTVLRRAFADPLKVSAMKALGFKSTLDGEPDNDGLILFANRLKEDGEIEVKWHGTSPETGLTIPKSTTITGRQFFQLYGTEAHRDIFGADFWVDASLPRWDGMGHTENGIFGIDHREDLVIFTDVRFPNERDRIHEWGGVVWRITRPGTGGDSHASEQALDGCDLTIANDGTVEEFGHVLAYHVDNLLGLVAN